MCLLLNGENTDPVYILLLNDVKKLFFDVLCMYWL